MTLPTSGIITLGMVRTELGGNLETQINLTDARTLFGKPSGPIKLTDGYGKSHIIAYRPTSVTTAGVTPTNPAYAYDTNTITVDQSTYSSVSTATVASTQTYIFTAAGTVTGTLHVYIPYLETELVTYTNNLGEEVELISTIDLSVSLDAGSSYATPMASFGGQTAIWMDGMIYTDIHLTKILTNQVIGNIRVKVSEFPVYKNPESCASSIHVSDIVIIPS